MSSDQIQGFIYSDVQRIRVMARSVERAQIEQIADKRLIEYMGLILSDRLSAGRQKGLQGWWNEDDCSIADLHGLLETAIYRGDMADVMIYAAMIHVRENADFYGRREGGVL